VFVRLKRVCVVMKKTACEDEAIRVWVPAFAGTYLIPHLRHPHLHWYAAPVGHPYLCQHIHPSICARSSSSPAYAPTSPFSHHWPSHKRLSPTCLPCVSGALFQRGSAANGRRKGGALGMISVEGLR
jgi:hypothetical protein